MFLLTTQPSLWHIHAWLVCQVLLVISVTVPGWMPLYRVVIAMQCTRVQFLAQLAYQTLIVVIVLAFFNSLEGYSLDPVFDQNRLQDSGKLWYRTASDCNPGNRIYQNLGTDAKWKRKWCGGKWWMKFGMRAWFSWERIVRIVACARVSFSGAKKANMKRKTAGSSLSPALTRFFALLFFLSVFLTILERGTGYGIGKYAGSWSLLARTYFNDVTSSLTVSHPMNFIQSIIFMQSWRPNHNLLVSFRAITGVIMLIIFPLMVPSGAGHLIIIS